MGESQNADVYSKNIIEFVTVAVEYCNFMEDSSRYSRKEFVDMSVKFLPLMYLKSVVLPHNEYVLDEPIEKFVSEQDYTLISQRIYDMLGRHDDYLEVFDENINRSVDAITSSISEDMTDIYQDVKDFVMAYKIGVDEIMNDALVDLVSNFEQFWGQKLVNVLRALHSLKFSGVDLDSDDEEEMDLDESSSPKRENWFSKRQSQWHSDDDDLMLN